jgi:hypothetical protein
MLSLKSKVLSRKSEKYKIDSLCRSTESTHSAPTHPIAIGSTQRLNIAFNKIILPGRVYELAVNVLAER